jgi:hypothetical protein
MILDEDDDNLLFLYRRHQSISRNNRFLFPVSSRLNVSY